MADAIVHRGPDEDGFLERPGLAFASRRLSIVGLADGRQPIFNEDRSVAVVFNGELFDYPEMKAELEGRGHRFRTHCDTELIPHLLGRPSARGCSSSCAASSPSPCGTSRRQRVVLGRDRFGICPLYWTRQTTPDGDWLLFASEIKALLASGMVEARPDPRGINHLFTFFALPGPVTCFEGVQLLPPGHYLRIQLGGAGEPARVSEHTYWEIDFPDRGQEDPGADAEAAGRRVRGGAAAARSSGGCGPTCRWCRTSRGGVDSSMVVALASQVRGTPIPTFTIRIEDPELDETSEAARRRPGTSAPSPIVVDCRRRRGAEHLSAS